ncbi:MAG: outer membrane lipoprotein-sorting protein [Deltaproteobacteria bacterium]|nr:outer membrane lipoprotein-sorting protein [Deltaproteobacteria bacterium]
MTGRWPAWPLACALSLTATSVFADAKGESWLKKLDQALSRPRDQEMLTEMVIQAPAGEPRRIGIRVHVRGGRRHMELLYPGDVKGTKILSLSRTQMYVYLPAYKKIRRIATHVRDQSLFGADYNYDDMSTPTYGDLYHAEFLGETKTQVRLRATLRAGQISPYGKIEFTLRKSDAYPEELKYFNARGTHIKTEVRRDYQCQQAMCVPRYMKMVDHSRSNHWTECLQKDWKLNTSFGEDVFSLRALQRSE